ncbi:hypothetical protein RJ640_009132 [Escallonia rubra]|uniref:F-box/LRR-repeat protein 15-like leucin rich repeat domain-containing protein n=1 Tax=Escallonia rubra TaxID=112253 RepID=A0AA88QRJ4_9ASTE|nr:hypothetical protein RJ640_009132 [Escallonia rubra]
MTILRSRQVLPRPENKPKPAPESPSKALKSGFSFTAIEEPITPAKILDPPSTRSSYESTPTSSSFAQSSVEPDPLRSGFTGFGSESGWVPSSSAVRRSVRLASKRGVHEIERVTRVSSRKRKIDVVSVEKNEGVDSGRVSGKVKVLGGGKENGVEEIGVGVDKLGSVVGTACENGLCLDFGAGEKVVSGKKKANVAFSGQIGNKIKVSGEGERVLHDGSLVGSECENGVCLDLGGSEKSTSMKKAKGKRNIDVVGVLGGDSVKESERGKGCFNLRSGKKVAKPKWEGFGWSDSLKAEGTSILGRVEKGESVDKDSIMSGDRVVDQPKLELGMKKEKSIGSAVPDDSQFAVSSDQNELKNVKSYDGIRDGVIRRLSREEKGKGKLVEVDLLSDCMDEVKLIPEPKRETSIESTVFGDSATPTLENVKVQAMETEAKTHTERTRDRFRNIAKKSASKFAHFSAREEEENHVVDEAEREMPQREVEEEMEDWPGPFSTAMKIIRDRGTNANMQQENSSLHKANSSPVVWVPRKDRQDGRSKLLVPSLQELCIAILSKNVDAITSLDSVPDLLRHRLGQLLCDTRRMNDHFFDLLLSGSPTEIRVRDCSWLTEERFTKSFEACDVNNLMVLQLDQCGRCLPDYVLHATLARSSNCLPALTTISLKGACRLSDVGLGSLLSSAPALRSINLSQCSLLTSDGINRLADSLGSVLRELYLDDCQSIDAMLIFHALSKMENLEVLSLVGLQTVCDDFVSQFLALCGDNIKELVLAECSKLTDSSLKVIAKSCSGLRAIDLSNLAKLTDLTLGYLANGCQAIQMLKMCRNAFSDEAIAAFLETSGEPLTELSLNNVNKVGHNTAISLARCSRNLLSLDLSWCRNLTNEAVGLIADSCSSLKVLKLFGCTQITNLFLDGHSNPQVQVIGLKMTPILEHIKAPDLLGPLQYSSGSSLI